MHKYFTQMFWYLDMNKKIIIIGSGWLGWPLAQHLCERGHQVIATTTKDDKVRQLNSDALRVIKLISTDAQRPETIAALEGGEIMVIAIPPRRERPDYLEQLQQLLKLAERLKIANILFISSSSVYGNNSGVITQDSAVNPATASATAMVEFERLLLNRADSCNTVLRLSGLIGPARHPGRFLAGKSALENPNAVVNMIERSDCIGLIEGIIMQNQWQNIFIGCAPSHPTRREFYSRGAIALGLTPPQFIGSAGDDSKLLDGRPTAAQLNYRYQHPDLMAWLEKSTN